MKNPLSLRCKAEFDSAVRSRGEDYSRSGRVQSFERMATGIRARVVGSGGTYAVSLDWTGVRATSSIRVRCSCPHYDEGNFCKHLWAVLLQVDARGCSSAVPGKGPLELEHVWQEGLLDTAEDYGEKDDDDDEDGDEDRRDPPYEPTVRYSSPRSALALLKGISQARRSRMEEERVEPSRLSRSWQTYFALRLSVGDAARVDFWRREKRKDGSWGVLRPWEITRNDLARHGDPWEREQLELLLTLNEGSGPGAYSHPSYGFYRSMGQRHSGAVIPGQLAEPVLRKLAMSGKLLLAGDPIPGITLDPGHSLAFDEGEPFAVAMAVERSGEGYLLKGSLRRGDEGQELSECLGVISPDLVVFDGRILRFEPESRLPWVEAVGSKREVRFTLKQADRVVESILSDPEAPPVEWPPELRWKSIDVKPGARVSFGIPRSIGRAAEVPSVPLTFEFDYGGNRVRATDPSSRVLDPARRQVFERKRAFEEEALEKAAALGVARVDASSFSIDAGRFAPACRAMMSWGWQVEAAGKKVLSGGEFRAEISSGIDWFDLSGSMDFEGAALGLASLIEAIERGEKWVRLGDGSIGILPEKWLDRLDSMRVFGSETGERLRFSRAQGLFLDLWLAEARVKTDRGFAEFRRKLRSFSGVRPGKEPRGFRGKLRPYQKEGLAWLSFLGDFGLGGILADDMGLGKTIQVLALLQEDKHTRRSARSGPSLAIVPKSLVGNWVAECARFSPELRVLNHTGLQRRELAAGFGDHDLIVTTYQTLRRDIGLLKDLRFNHLIADEAQNIKNPDSQLAKCCRILHAHKKLAMTGTPIENGLGDLFSILDFANPGLITEKAKERYERQASIGDLSKALRPVILRRTKAEVLKDLPAKVEQTLFCEPSPEEARVYRGIRDHYRAKLARSVEENGMARSRIQILTALLRLRQAACHPGLLDARKYADLPGSKLELLVERLKEAVAEGHKCLVFSQFTSFLSIVGERLKRAGVDFEYLDGKTRDREAGVRRFQESDRLRVFLISLKAGGTGLNLTAADYVFLLDPWWNPAVEAQAMDRAHRIGQKRTVFSYRLIAKGTVEEKVLELQERKRELAKAVISSDSSFLRKMSREDLELLLS